ncbi:MAG: class I SAM-dependent methyltransferase [Phycisphaerales bacterium]|nr:class I SAM-dependent methyltransferase [Phycisphaerales bacterium]
MPKTTARIASTADRHMLYQRAVQCVEAEIDFVDETFARLRGRKARTLREDFCGTFNTSCEWVRRRPTNIAIGLDLHEPTLEWGREHNLAGLTPSQRDRLHIHNADVLTPPPAARPPGEARKHGLDAVLAMNFSFWCFKRRGVMLDYFRAVRESLRGDGILFLDFYGGSDAYKELRERREVVRVRKGEEGWYPRRNGGPPVYYGPFTYIWQQEKFNPITGDLTCHIHFRFPDGSSIRRAFTYEWRLWSIPEIRDCLADAGFGKTTVYWEGDDGKGGGDGNFTASEQGDAGASHICYITAEK